MARGGRDGVRRNFREDDGTYAPIDHPDRIETAFTDLGLGPDDVDLLVASDAGKILGIGDWVSARNRPDRGMTSSKPVPRNAGHINRSLAQRSAWRQALNPW
jgi:Malic enzyme, N-terminal domain